MITTHPQRWTNRPLPWLKELVGQNLKNVVKAALVKRRQAGRQLFMSPGRGPAIQKRRELAALRKSLAAQYKTPMRSILGVR